MILGATGCPPPSAETVQNAERINEVQRLKDENEQLKAELAQKNDQMAMQSATLAELRGMTGDRSLDKIVHVDRLAIDPLSGGYDDDRDGVDEGVVVYLSLFDQFGGTMRAAGSASVTLLNLADPKGSKVVGEVNLTADALAKMWYGAFLTSHYTIKIPWAGGAARPPAKDITVVVTFTDLLTGRVFTDQRVVGVTGFGAATTLENK
ncbi:MAG: hypothetical protein IPK83_19265 [Planctomycetes bacterium]|nr:hypothetical protein [Planctomycetota bacterium]